MVARVVATAMLTLGEKVHFKSMYGNNILKCELNVRDKCNECMLTAVQFKYIIMYCSLNFVEI